MADARTQPADVTRCHGYRVDGEWREGCADCQRRTSPQPNPDRVLYIAPPLILAFECQYRIPPDE